MRQTTAMLLSSGTRRSGGSQRQLVSDRAGGRTTPARGPGRVAGLPSAIRDVGVAQLRARDRHTRGPAGATRNRPNVSWPSTHA